MASFPRFKPFSIYHSLSPLLSLNAPSSNNQNDANKENGSTPVDDVDGLLWKLYGKNEEFRIMHDAAVTIQSFWRGCSSRTITSSKIQNMIEDIIALRKLEAEYRRRDKEEHIKQQEQHDETYCQEHHKISNNGYFYSDRIVRTRLERRKSRHKPWRLSTEDTDYKKRITPVITLTNRLERRKNQNKPWRLSTEDTDRKKRINSVVTPTKSSSLRDREQDDKEALTANHTNNFLESADTNNRGYQRYRVHMHGKNKTRPWRDDTSVFDAY